MKFRNRQIEGQDHHITIRRNMVIICFSDMTCFPGIGGTIAA